MTDTPSKQQLREFAALLGFGLPIIFGWLIPTLHQHPFRTWTLWVGIPSLLFGIAAPWLLIWPYKVWMALGDGLGWLNRHLILGLVYIVVLQPIALVMRMLGHDPLRRKRNPGAESYREIRTHPPTDLKRIF